MILGCSSIRFGEKNARFQTITLYIIISKSDYSHNTYIKGPKLLFLVLSHDMVYERSQITLTVSPSDTSYRSEIGVRSEISVLHTYYSVDA